MLNVSLETLAMYIFDVLTELIEGIPPHIIITITEISLQINLHSTTSALGRYFHKYKIYIKKGRDNENVAIPCCTGGRHFDNNSQRQKFVNSATCWVYTNCIGSFLQRQLNLGIVKANPAPTPSVFQIMDHLHTAVPRRLYGGKGLSMERMLQASRARGLLAIMNTDWNLWYLHLRNSTRKSFWCRSLYF